VSRGQRNESPQPRPLISVFRRKKDSKMRKTINVQVKQEIIEKHEGVAKASAVVSEYGLPQSRIPAVMLLFMLYPLFIYVLININASVCSYNIYLLKLHF
jgi:hypothetical protein